MLMALSGSLKRTTLPELGDLAPIQSSTQSLVWGFAVGLHLKVRDEPGRVSNEEGQQLVVEVDLDLVDVLHAIVDLQHEVLFGGPNVLLQATMWKSARIS